MENKPFTKTGKELLATRSYHWQLCGLNLLEEECTCYLGECIIAIEKEARFIHLYPEDNERCDGKCFPNECVCPEGGWEAEAGRLRETNERLQQTIRFQDGGIYRMGRSFNFCPYCGNRLAIVFSGHTCGMPDID